MKRMNLTADHSYATTSNLVFTLDRVGRPVTIAQGANTTALAYNDSGQTVSETFNGLAVTNDYDSLPRRVAVAYSVDAVRLVKSGYDAASRLTGTTNGTYFCCLHSDGFSAAPLPLWWPRTPSR